MGSRATLALLTLLGVFGSLSVAHADGRLRLYIFPSPSGIQWKSPSALTRSTLFNALALTPYQKKHPIGHVNVDLRCRNSEGKVRRVLTGMTTAETQTSDEHQALFQDRIGLGVLFKNFEGRLETSQEIRLQLSERMKRGDLSVVEFQINNSSCERLLVFHDTFEKEGMSKHYGLPNRPRHREGAGCTAYAMAYLELAGILSPEMHQRWWKSIRVPIDMIGGGEANTPFRRVSFLRLLFSWWRGWAISGEESRTIEFWDPDAMHQWALEVFQSHRIDFQRISLDESVGLIRDERSTATPTDPIFYP